MAGSVSRGVMVVALCALLALAGGCSGSRGVLPEVDDELRPVGDRVPDESALLVSRGDAIELLEELGLTSEAQPWQVRLVARVPRGWAWVVSSTEYELDDGRRGGLVFVRAGRWQTRGARLQSRRRDGRDSARRRMGGDPK
jgi:hypothetical protein